jgi:acetyl esterase/lipase
MIIGIPPPNCNHYISIDEKEFLLFYTVRKYKFLAESQFDVVGNFRSKSVFVSALRFYILVFSVKHLEYIRVNVNIRPIIFREEKSEIKEGKLKVKRKSVYVLPVLLLIIAFASYYFLSIDKKQHEKTSNITYGENGQKLDLYTPKGTNIPVILYVHGGGWSGGNKENVSAKPAFFTKNGYAFISINYRLHPKVSYEEMAEDVATALRWVYENADTYNLDQERINLMGHSAGGHLIMLVGTNSKYLQANNLSADIIHSLVDLDGPVDLESFIQRLPSYKKVFGGNKNEWAVASPITYAVRQQLPPSFLITRDQNTSTLRFIDIVKRNQNEVLFYGYAKISHSEVTKLIGVPSAGTEAREITNAILTFLNTHNK